MSDGLCLRHAMDLAQSMSDSGIKNVMYVQGTVTNKSLGTSFKHAWVELPKENKVIDPTIYVRMPKQDYYRAFSPKNVIKMDTDVAALLVWKMGELKFFTKSEVSAVENHLKELDKRMGKKRK